MNIRFDGPGKYVVSTKEKIQADFLDIFAIQYLGPSLQLNDRFQNKVIIEVKDQAELSGFLIALYNHRYTLIGVDRLPENSHEETNDLIQ